MRLRVLLLTFVLLIPALPLSAASGEPWVFEGGGWGHGVGLSQFGSQGMALDDFTDEQIIDHYYSGADVKTLGEIGEESWLNDPEAIWVGLASNQTARTFEAVGNGVTVCQTGDETDTCGSPDETLTEGQTLTVAVASTDPLRCRRMVDDGDPIEGDCWIDIDLQDGTLVGVEQGIQLYVRGTMRIRPNSTQPTGGDKFHVSVSVGLEHYIYGISETLLWFEPAALETQAIIARSYGVRRALDSAKSDGTLEDGRNVSCWCHISSSPAVDQNYDGWDVDNEGSSTHGSKWRKAVDDTASEIVTHPKISGGNTVVSTFYSSSNGGASENSEDVWGGVWPHLKSVDDPWSADPDVNPLATWSVKVSDADMAAFFGWDRALDATVLEGPPGVLVKFSGVDNGASVSTTLNGTQIRSILISFGFDYHAPGTSSTVVRVSPYITAVSDPPGFDDIVGNTFEGDIEWLGEQGITKGCNPPDNTMFCPDDEVTRGQMAAFIKRFLDLPTASKDYFTDDNGTTFENDINSIAEAGITKGCNPPENSRYCADDDVSREQMAAFLVRALGLTANTHSGFDDVSSTNTFFADIGKLATAGITKGCNPPDNTRFCPDSDVTRGQMAAFLHRADKLK